MATPPRTFIDPLEPRVLLAVGPFALIAPALAQSYATVVAAPSWTIQSPTGQVSATVTLDSAGRPSYTVNRAGQAVLAASPLGVTMAGAGGNFSAALQFVSQSSRAIDETFS